VKAGALFDCAVNYRMKTKPTRFVPGGLGKILLAPYPHNGKPMQQQAAPVWVGQNTQ
jgi:hypothetical protein